MSKILVLGSKPEIPESLSSSLARGGWEVSFAQDAVHAKQLLNNHKIDALLFRFDRSGNGAEQFNELRWLHQLFPGLLIILLNSAGTEAATTGDFSILQAIHSPRREEPFNNHGSLPLTRAQQRIAEMVAHASSNREIAHGLGIKEQSVRNELSRIFKKIHIKNRVELALLMREGRQAPKSTSETEEAAEYRRLRGVPTADEPAAVPPSLIRNVS